MFKRKLNALDYVNAESFDVNDEQQLRTLIVWLEDQKIRHHKIEDREFLRTGDWAAAFPKYLNDLGYAATTNPKEAMLDWLLGYAVRLEYGDNIDKYRTVSSTSAGGGGDAAVDPNNPLASIDFDSADFKAGVTSLAAMLQVPPHEDHQVVLRAVSILIREKLGKDKLAELEKSKSDGKKQPSAIPLDKVELGFETGDYITAEAAKILRLLHIQELRDLQTAINEAIVKVQAFTANPKTDSRLGKVGR